MKFGTGSRWATYELGGYTTFSWTVTEVGRQPWIIQDVMRTEDAVTQVPNQFVALGGFTALYVVLAVACTWLLLRLAKTPPPIESPHVAPRKETAHAVA